MSLNEDEQRVLRDIEKQLRQEDPALAGTLDGIAEQDHRQQRTRLGERLIGIGLLVFFIGLIAQDGLLSVGSVVLSYGLLTAVVGTVTTLRNRPRPSAPGAGMRY